MMLLLPGPLCNLEPGIAGGATVGSSGRGVKTVGQAPGRGARGALAFGRPRGDNEGWAALDQVFAPLPPSPGLARGREGEAPAELLSLRLGGSLALPGNPRG